MRWLRIGLFTLAGLAALLFTLIAVLFTVDFGRFKGQIETLVTDTLGQEFRIDGVLRATIGSSIEIYAENAYLANPVWAKSEAFVSVAKLDIAIDMWSLFSQPIIVQRADINGVRVNLEMGEQGASWQFEGLMQDPDTPVEPSTTRAHIPVVVDHVAIQDTIVSLDRDQWNTPLIIDARSLFADQRDGNNIQVIMKGALNGTPLNFNKTTGPISNLQELRDVHSVLSGNIGDISIEGEFHIDDLLSPRKPTMDLVIDGPNAQYLTDVLGVPAVTSGPLNFRATIEHRGDKLDAKIVGQFGEFSLDADGVFTDLQNHNDMDLTVDAGGPDIGTIIRLLGRQYTDVDAFHIRGRLFRTDDDLTVENVLVTIGESKLTADGFFDEFPRASNARLAVVATGPDFGRFNRLFGMPGRLGGEFRATLDIGPNGDGRTLIELGASAPHADISIQSNLSSLEKFVDSTIKFEIIGSDIGFVAEAAGWPGLPNEAWEISGFVEKDGSGYRITDVSLLAGDDVFTVNGHIGDDPIGSETDVEIDFRGTDLGASFAALGGEADRLPKGSYELKGRIQHQNETLSLQGVQLVIGDNDDYKFNVSGNVNARNGFVGSEIDILAKGTSTAALVELVGIKDFPDFPFDVSANVLRGDASTQITDGRLDVGTVDATFAGTIGDNPLQQDLSLTVGLSTPNLPAVIAEFGVPIELVPPGDLQLFARIIRTRDRLSINKLEITLDDTVLNVDGTVGHWPELNGTDVNVSIAGSNLDALMPEQFSKKILRHNFSLTAGVKLDDGTISISDIDALLANTLVQGDAKVALEPVLSNGNFDLKSSSPDLYSLLPVLHGEDTPPVAKMSFEGSGSWEDGFWTFEDLDFRLADGRIQINGSVDGPPSFDRTDLNVDWQASTLSRLSHLVGRDLPDQPMFLTARLVGKDTVMTMEKFQLKSGDTDLAGDFTLTSGDILFLDVDVTSNVIDLVPFQAELVQSGESAQSPEKTSKDKLIPDTPLPLELFKSFDAKIDIDVAELRSRALLLRGLELKGSVNSGEVAIDRLKLIGVRDGELVGSARLIPLPDGGADVTIDLDGFDLVMGLMADTSRETQQLPLSTLKSSLTGTGNTARDIAGSLNGYFRLVAGQGKYKSGAFAMFTQDFLAQVVSTVNPFSKTDPYVSVECSAILIKFTDGVMTGKPVLVQKTEKLLIFADANVSLKTEKVDASIRTIPQKGLGISLTNLVNPYIKIGGTLAKPSLAIDPEGVLIEGGVAVATAGLSILAKGLKDRFLSDKHPCSTAVKAADEKFGLPPQAAN